MKTFTFLIFKKNAKIACLIILLIIGIKYVWITNNILDYVQETGGVGWYGVTIENRQKAVNAIINDATTNSTIVLIDRTIFPPGMRAYSFLFSVSLGRIDMRLSELEPIVMRLNGEEIPAHIMQILQGKNSMDNAYESSSEWVYYIFESSTQETRLRYYIDTISDSKITIGPERIFVYKLRLGSIERIGQGGQVTLMQDGVASKVRTKYSYFQSLNVTHYSEEAIYYLEVNGSTDYSINSFPTNWSYDHVSPRPLSLNVDANSWINFIGSKDAVYTIYWTTNPRYQSVGWKDDSFKSGWYINKVSSYDTDGDILGFTIMEGVRAGYIEHIRLNIDLDKYPVVIIRAKATGNYRLTLAKDGIGLSSFYISHSDDFRITVLNTKYMPEKNFNRLWVHLYGERNTIWIDYILFASIDYDFDTETS